MLPLKKRASQPSSAGPIGELAGEYRLMRKIGAGGFGTVYEAEHPVLKRRAAVKVLHASAGVESIAVRRFLEEARSASQIRHRHIVDIFSFGTLPNGQYFYVMDLLDGVALDRFIRTQGRLAPELALPLLRRVAQALDALHAASIIHRDVKPANIFLAWESSGEVVPKLLDFGLVKLLGDVSMHTASGVPIGTPYYMSPEQCRGEAVDARADVYSFGVICHELLTGRVPFARDSAAAVLLAHVLEPPPRMSEVCPEVSADLDDPVLHMLAKDPKARPDSAGAAMRELTLAAQGAGVTMADSLPWLPRPALEAEPDPVRLDSTGSTADAAFGLDTASGTRGKRVSAAPGNARPVWIALALGALALAGAAVYWASQRPATQPQAAASAAVAAGTQIPTRPSQEAAGPGTTPTATPAAATPTPAAGAMQVIPSSATATGSAAAATPMSAASGPRTTAPSATSPQSPAAATPTSAAPGTQITPPSAMPAAGDAVPPTAAADALGATPAAARIALTLRGAPPGAAVMLDDEKLGEAPGPIWLPKGDQPLRLTVIAPGYGPKSVRVTPAGPLDLVIPRERGKRGADKRGALRDLEDPF